MLVNALPPREDGRTRYVTRQWLRDPKGPLLTKPPLQGVRTPNDLIWGHDLNDFFWIQRFPGIDALTIWSRSMIKELGENYDECEFDQPDSLQVPRQRYPWPVLQLPPAIFAIVEEFGDKSTQLGIIDQGCETHSKPDYVPKYRKSSKAKAAHIEEKDAELAVLVKRLLALDDEDGIFVRNSPNNPMVNSAGEPYTLLWASPFRVGFMALFACMPQGLPFMPLVSTMIDLRPPIEAQFDAVGVKVLRGLDQAALLELEGPLATREASSGPSKDPENTLVAMDEVSAKGNIPEKSPFSISEIPKLEEFIPIAYFPDVLHVHDPHSVTTATVQSYGYTPRANAEGPPIVYKRVFPKLARDTTIDGHHDSFHVTPRVAHLHLAQQNRCGVGNHSLVHRAPLTLPEPLTAHSRNGRVRVAAKSAFASASAREMLRKEAKLYDAFPRHLMEDWCGFNIVTPGLMHPVPVGPVVPKLYGYYVPVKIVDGKEVLCEEISGARSPILLLEECGEPVKPEKFTIDIRYVVCDPAV